MNNYECGLYLNDPAIIAELHTYFNNLKTMSGVPLTWARCAKWKEEIASRAEIVNAFISSLPDCGASQSSIDQDKNYYIKFFGTGSNRVPFDFPVREELERALCHYACCFSKSPRQFNDNDIIYMGRMTSPSDFAIFGKAEAIHYVEERDRASRFEIEQRDWKEGWPLYLRVKNAIFVDGRMGDCVLLYDLIRSLDYQSFPSTMARYNSGERNISPFKSLSQRAYIKLTKEAAEWLEPRFQQSIRREGSVSHAFIAGLPQATMDVSM
jgi:hypothetical protein